MVERSSVLTSGMVWSVALMPLLGTLSGVTLFGGFTLNWLTYFPIVLSLAFYLLTGSRWPRLALIASVVVLVYLSAWVLQSEQINLMALIRLLLSILPLLLTMQLVKGIDKVDLSMPALVFSFGVVVTLVMALLQLAGILPYKDFDYVDGVQVGRISGGYEKPVIFTVVLFPVFLWAASIYKTHRLRSALTIVAVLWIVFVSGLRTALIVYLFLTLLLALRIDFYKAVRLFLKCLGPMLIAFALVTLLWAIGELLPGAGLLRGRLGMWIAHANELFGGGLMRFLLGSGNTSLDAATLARFDVYHANEVHNDFIRIVVYGGIVGSSLFSYLLYRHFSLTSAFFRVSKEERYLYSFPIIFLVLYMVTNEPSFYPSFFWLLAMSSVLVLEFRRRGQRQAAAR